MSELCVDNNEKQRRKMTVPEPKTRKTSQTLLVPDNNDKRGSHQIGMMHDMDIPDELFDNFDAKINKMDNPSSNIDRDGSGQINPP